MKKLIFTIIVLVFTLFCITAKAGPTYSFVNITNNNAIHAAIGEAQLSVELIEIGSNQVNFFFTNTGLYASSITQVYFDDGTLLGIASIDNSSTGVSFFHPETSPPDLPGGNNVSPPFVVTTGFSAGSDSPVQLNGVNPGEYVGIIFDLQPGGIFQDVIDELASGELRIGIHVQGFASGGSEAFVNNGIVDGNGNGPHCPIPAPGAVLLGSIGAGFVGWLRRRRTL